MTLQSTRKCKRQTVWQTGQLFLLFSLFIIRTLAQVPDSKIRGTGGTVPAFQAPSTAEVDRAIALAANYLTRACSPDGRFVYRVSINSGEQSRSYNIVRHSGAIYALAMLHDSKPDQGALDSMVRAALFLRKNYIGPGALSDQMAVWSKPLPQPSAADLGATGLGLVALTALNGAKPNSVPPDQLKALGRFLLFLQRSDGSFVSKYSAESGPDEDFESLYYPGEAALGLIDLYEVDHSLIWLNAAAKALAYLARSRAQLPRVPPDHWALIATAKLLPYYALSASPASKDELIQHAIQICNALMKDQLRNPITKVLDGAFDTTGRTAPTATRMEGLLAALEFLPEGRLRTEIEETVVHGITFLLHAQIHNGPFAGGMPGADIPTSPGTSDIRVDFVQHALCAWLRYQRLFQRTTAASWDNGYPSAPMNRSLVLSGW